jgi:hypothetical protein
MTTMHRDPLVDDYLRRLDAAAAHLPRARRAELAAEIEEHIDDALREGGVDDEAAVRNVLERLGPPEEIVAAGDPPPEETLGRRGRLETAALIVLAVGVVLPGVGYLIGAGLVVASRAWSGRDKLVGLAIPPLVFLLGGMLVLLVAAEETSGAVEADAGGLGPYEITVLAANAFSGLLAAGYLGGRLRRRPAA